MWLSRSGHGSWEPETETGGGMGEDILLSPARLYLPMGPWPCKQCLKLETEHPKINRVYGVRFSFKP